MSCGLLHLSEHHYVHAYCYILLMKHKIVLSTNGENPVFNYWLFYDCILILCPLCVCRRVPFIGAKKVSSAPMSTLETDRHVSLRRFFSHLFKNELLEARKYIHIIEEYLKHENFQQCFVGELVSHLTLYGGSVSREQYDIFARIINTAILYEEMAVRLLPLLSAIYHVSQFSVYGGMRCTTLFIPWFVFNLLQIIEEKCIRLMS